MARILTIHPDNPQPRLLQQVAELLQQGEVLVVPTDASYALVCQLDHKAATEQLRRIRNMDDKDLLTVLCSDISAVSNYAQVDNSQFRLIKKAIPGAYTFVLEATKEVPRRAQHPTRKTIGVRVPQNTVLQDLLKTVQAPLLAATLHHPQQAEAWYDVSDVEDAVGTQVAAIVDGGYLSATPSTVIDLIESPPAVLRIGAGETTLLGL